MNNSGQYNINTGNSYCLVILVMHTDNKSQDASLKNAINESDNNAIQHAESIRC